MSLDLAVSWVKAALGLPPSQNLFDPFLLLFSLFHGAQGKLQTVFQGFSFFSGTQRPELKVAGRANSIYRVLAFKKKTATLTRRSNEKKKN